MDVKGGKGKGEAPEDDGFNDGGPDGDVVVRRDDWGADEGGDLACDAAPEY